MVFDVDDYCNKRIRYLPMDLYQLSVVVNYCVLREEVLLIACLAVINNTSFVFHPA